MTAPTETKTEPESETPERVEDAAPESGWKQRSIDILDAYMERDPAATSRLAVALTSTGLHAVMWHVMCHAIWQTGLQIVARMVANIGRWLFGIEIHPQVEIGRRLFIDHGMGVVIGGTSKIGDDVSIYQGVTLGGITQVDKGKRHPTLEDGVVIGAGAKVLGPITIGAGARVGSNAVVVKDVKPGASVVGVPAHETGSGAKKKSGFVAYAGCEDDDVASPEKLLEEMKRLKQRIQKLEKNKD